MVALRLACTCLLLATLTGCADPASPGAQASSAANASAGADATSAPMASQAGVAAATSAKPTACTLVTADAMSTVFARAMQSEPNEGAVDKTECIYKPADAPSPYVELTVEWGEGEAAMRAAGAMSRAEPGIVDPYAGIGDQAVSVGTTLMIRKGDDLVTITFSGVDDAPAKAKAIFAIVETRM